MKTSPSIDYERLRKVITPIVFVIVLLVLYILFEGVFGVINQIQSDDSALFPLAVILYLITFLILLMIASLVTTALDEFLRREDRRVPIDDPPKNLKDLRKELMECVSSDSLTSLDEYWEIVVTMLTVGMLVLSMIATSIAPLANWVQVIITLVFWALYKVGKARHSVDIRLLLVAALVQFVVIISVLYATALGIEMLLVNWMANDTPIDPRIPYAAPEWLLTFYALMFISSFFVYLSRAAGKRVSIYWWRRLAVEDLDEKRLLIAERNATYLVESALPSYLFYGAVWFLALLIPTSVAFGLSDFYIGLVQATSIVLVIVVLGWMTCMWIAQYRITRTEPGWILSFFLKSGSRAMRVAGILVMIFVGVAIFILLPVFAFNFVMLNGSQFIGPSNALNAAFILFFVQGLSASRSRKAE